MFIIWGQQHYQFYFLLYFLFVERFSLFMYICKPHVVMKRVDSASGLQLPPSIALVRNMSKSLN